MAKQSLAEFVKARIAVPLGIEVCAAAGWHDTWMTGVAGGRARACGRRGGQVAAHVRCWRVTVVCAGPRVVSRVSGVSAAELRAIVDGARSGKGVAGAKPFIKPGVLCACRRVLLMLFRAPSGGPWLGCGGACAHRPACRAADTSVVVPCWM